MTLAQEAGAKGATQRPPPPQHSTGLTLQPHKGLSPVVLTGGLWEGQNMIPELSSNPALLLTGRAVSGEAQRSLGPWFRYLERAWGSHASLGGRGRTRPEWTVQDMGSACHQPGSQVTVQG